MISLGMGVSKEEPAELTKRLNKVVIERRI